MVAAKDSALLVIDELQERGESDFENHKQTHIVDARYSRELPTILIANYTREEFAASVSPSILDRIRENGIGVFFDWPSFRTLPDCHVKREAPKSGGIWK
jgi:DNA replication protein DnaC